MAGSANIAFVTSSTQSALSIASLAGADAICAMRATEAHLPGTYVAILSDTTTTARQRLGSSRGWVRTDGKPLADRVDDLLGGKLIHPIDVDEQGASAAGGVLTASNSDGSCYADACSNFTTAASNTQWGDPQATASNWIANGVDSCGNNYRLYCAGVGGTTPLTFTPATGRKAFVTVQVFNVGSGGIGAADVLCGNEASAAGLTGTFSALLATSGASASSRFNLAGAPWVRTDGVQLAATALGFMSGNLDAPLNVTAVGTYTAGVVWTGGSLTAPQAGNQTCGDWTTSGATASVGIAQFTGPNAYSNTAGWGCGVPNLIYCLEQ